jgi:hypothetical protein
MTRYRDPRGSFGIEYPIGWHVRPPAASARGTSFYLDDPDEGIAVTVLAQGAVPGHLDASRLAPLLTDQMRQRYPDFAFTAVSTRADAGGGEHSEFQARWTNRWAQPMRARGVLVSAPRGAETAYAFVAGQAQELVFASLEPVFVRILGSFRPGPGG